MFNKLKYCDVKIVFEVVDRKESTLSPLMSLAKLCYQVVINEISAANWLRLS